MAQAAQAPNQLEGLFDRMHQLMDSGSHSKVVKVAEQSEWGTDAVLFYIICQHHQHQLAGVQQQGPSSSRSPP